METISDLIQGAAAQLGRTFFLAGVLPMLLLFGVLQHILTITNINLFLSDFGGVDRLFWSTVALAVITGVIPVLLNRPIVRFFEGYWPGSGILGSGIKKQHKQLYADIQDLRSKRLALLTDYEQTGEYDEETDNAIQVELHDKHSEREKTHPIPLLPFDENYLMPTTFGNAWASGEEVTRVRYGMDGMIFWPYIRNVIAQENLPLLNSIDNAKLLMDVCLHLCLISGILVPVSIYALIINTTTPAIAVLAAVVAMIGFGVLYRLATAYARSMNQHVVMAYDLHRWDLLDRFGIKRPTDLDEEYWVWQRLASFLRRSESYYFEYFEMKDDA